MDIQGKRLGKKILELDHVSKSFDGHCILRDFSYKFVRGEKIGIVGKNGVGKSTFLNIITQNLQPDSGSISIGETVVYGYYKQSGIAFNETDRVIDIVKTLPNASIWATGELCPLLNSWNISCSPTNSNIPWSKS